MKPTLKTSTVLAYDFQSCSSPLPRPSSRRKPRSTGSSRSRVYARAMNDPERVAERDEHDGVEDDLGDALAAHQNRSPRNSA